MVDPAAQVEKLKRRIAKLEQDLHTDELTHLLNRRGLFFSLKPLVNAAQYQLNNPQKRKSFIVQALSLLFIDIDHFKQVNDTYGHPAGDEALRAIGDCLRKNVREIDLVARLGGEEMVVILIGANQEEAAEIAENLRQKIEELELSRDGKKIPITASFGVATLAKDMTVEQLLLSADQAMYQAKKTGRNRVVIA